MISPDAFIHPNALVDEGVAVGAGTRVWAFAHLVRGAFVGEDCNICDHTFIEAKVRAGNRVTIKSGVQLWDSTRVDDDVFIGPNATFTNDRAPRSKKNGWKRLRTKVQKVCYDWRQFYDSTRLDYWARRNGV
jgi:UDP-2-acetamido-3-amino-2,3-dideoxy-glucuronate N-acetyltransferase